MLQTITKITSMALKMAKAVILAIMKIATAKNHATAIAKKNAPAPAKIAIAKQIALKTAAVNP